jgi:hypothetical protein
MDIKDVLMVMEADRPSEAVLATSIGLAKAHRAAVHAVCITPWRPSPADCFALGPRADLDVLERLDRKASGQVAPLKQAFLTGVGEGGLEGDWGRLDEVEAPFAVPSRARSCDIVVMRRPHAGEPTARELAECSVRNGGTPCLFVPDDAKNSGEFSRIVLAWNGTAEAKRAVDSSMPLLKRASRVDLIVVGRPAAIDIYNHAMAMVCHLARHGVECVAHERGGRASHVTHALMEACEDLDADLLVLGAYSHAHMTEALVGGTTSSSLVEASIPVWMFH